MNLLLRAVKIIDPGAPHHSKTLDIYIQDGVIHDIGTALSPPADAEVMEEKGLHVSMGWVDTYAHFCDPGYEYRETLESGAQAAAAGGFTHVFIRPDTDPVLDDKGGVEYIQSRNARLTPTIHALGSISSNMDGNTISGMYDMHNAGAIAFTDADQPVHNNGLMLRALQYVLPINGIVYNLPHTPDLAVNGQMHEGEMSVQLGMKGIPSLAEELMIHRDLFLAAYSGSRLHINKVSTQKGVELIANAKKEGLKVTASVSVYHLLLEESKLATFDANYKTTPPLRTEKDRQALVQGVLDGTIDIICSDHNPQELEHKRNEFEYAHPGMITLDYAFGAIRKGLGDQLSLADWVRAASKNPREIFGLENHQIEKGKAADLTLFFPDAPWKLEKKSLHSKSFNTPFLDTELKGRVKGIINKTKTYWNE